VAGGGFGSVGGGATYILLFLKLPRDIVPELGA
jgi:hypothetical protein